MGPLCARPRPRAGSSRSPFALDERREPHAARDAERRDAAFLAARREAMQEGDEDARAGRADRMAERDRTAVGVDRLVAHAEAREAGEHLRRERLVELHLVDGVKLEAGAG